LEIIMKKIVSIILAITLLASFSVILTSCDESNNKGGGGGAVVMPPNINGGEPDGGEDEIPDGGDPVNPPPASNKLIGVVGAVNAYNPEENSTYVRVDVPQFTDTIVYLLAYEAIPSITARYRNITNGVESEITLGEWTYHEELGIYYAAFNAPNAAGNAMYQVITTINGEESGRIFAVQVMKQMNIDPDGWV
jgi:hypothetical protein